MLPWARSPIEQVVVVGAATLMASMSRASSHTSQVAGSGKMSTVASRLGHSVEHVVHVRVARLLVSMVMTSGSAPRTTGVASLGKPPARVFLGVRP